MAIYASANGGGNFTPHPTGGFPAVCVDVFDNGYVKTLFEGQEKIQHKVTLYFYCGENIEKETQDGAVTVPLLVSRRFTLSLADSSHLRPFLEAWRNKKFTRDELERFDVESLIGVPAFIQVSHNEKGDNVYANIDGALKLPRGMSAPAIPEGFVRRQDRPERENGNGQRKPDMMDALAQAHRKDNRSKAAAGPPSYAGEPEPSFGDDDSEDLPF